MGWLDYGGGLIMGVATFQRPSIGEGSPLLQLHGPTALGHEVVGHYYSAVRIFSNTVFAIIKHYLLALKLESQLR